MTVTPTNRSNLVDLSLVIYRGADFDGSGLFNIAPAVELDDAPNLGQVQGIVNDLRQTIITPMEAQIQYLANNLGVTETRVNELIGQFWQLNEAGELELSAEQVARIAQIPTIVGRLDAAEGFLQTVATQAQTAVAEIAQLNSRANQFEVQFNQVNGQITNLSNLLSSFDAVNTQQGLDIATLNALTAQHTTLIDNGQTIINQVQQTIQAILNQIRHDTVLFNNGVPVTNQHMTVVEETNAREAVYRVTDTKEDLWMLGKLERILLGKYKQIEGCITRVREDSYSLVVVPLTGTYEYTGM